MVPEANASLAEGPRGSLSPALGAAPVNGSQGEGLLLPTFSAAALARVVLTLLLCVVSTVCNVAVLWAGVGRKGARRSHARVLLLHLAAADLLVALLVMPVDAAWNLTVQWRAGDVACRLLMFLKLLAMYASAFLTALISLDRHAAVLRPLALAEAGRRSRLSLPAAWLLSAGLSVPQLFLFHTVTVGSPPRFTQCSTRGSFAQRSHEAAYNMLTFSGLFLLPLLVMVSCYTRILLQISPSKGSSGHASAPELPLRRSCNPIPRARMRMLRLSVAIVCSFVVCWTPYYLLGLWYWFWPVAMEGSVPHSLAHLLFTFGLLNACLDPLLYGLFAGPWPQRLWGCCRAHGGGRLPQPSSQPTGSFHSSMSTTGLRRGAAKPPRSLA